jgi:hypothetical protein
MKPGSYVTVIIEEGSIVLEPEEAAKPASCPPVASLASVA